MKFETACRVMIASCLLMAGGVCNAATKKIDLTQGDDRGANDFHVTFLSKVDSATLEAKSNVEVALPTTAGTTSDGLTFNWEWVRPIRTSEDGRVTLSWTPDGVEIKDFHFTYHSVHPVPVPATIWLLGPGLASLAGAARRNRVAAEA